MSSVRAIEAEVSIKSGVQAECTIGREVIVEVHDDVNLESLTVTANGGYTPAEGVDGFSDVSVAVPERVPVTESLSVTQNGTYEPSEGIDGYDRVAVSVPPTVPDIEPLTVTENGTYTADGDGYNPVTVAVPERVLVTESLSVTANGTYTPSSGVDGFNSVTVNVPAPVPLGITLDWADVQEITIGPNSVSNSIDAQTYLSSFTYTFLILKDALTVNNQLVFAGSNNLGTSITGMYRCRNNTIGSISISASYDCKLVEGSVYYAITKKTS